MPMGKDTVIADVGNAAEAVNTDEEAANPLHEIQSLCMRCGKNIWDNLIIETGLKDYYDRDIEELITALQENITGTWSDEVPTWEKCSKDELACPGKYASESIKLACNWGYKDAENNTVLGDEYFLSRWPIVETQLAKAGVRLAATLNRIFT